MNLSNIDLSTGEVLPQGAGGAMGRTRSVGELEAMLSAAAERNVLADERITKAYGLIAHLRAQVAALQEQVDEKRQHFHRQLAIAQGRLQTIAAKKDISYPTKKGTGNVEISYADLGDMLDEIRPTLAELGISYRQPIIDHPTDRTMITVQTVLACDGYEEVVSSLSFASSAKSGGDFKVLGSGITHVRRYTLAASLGLAVAGKSQEGKAGRGSGYGKQNLMRRDASPAAEKVGSGHQATSSPSAEQHIIKQLRSLPFAKVVELFNSLSADQKKDHKQLFNERRSEHQAQVKRSG